MADIDFGFFKARPWDSPLNDLLSSPPSWSRLEPQSVTGDPAAGLSAAIADPLWMLFRQWQFGEFRGEDAGTPINVLVEGSAAPIHSVQPGDWTGTTAPAGALPDPAALDREIERERGGPPPLRQRILAAELLTTTLHDAGFGAQADTLRRIVALDAPADTGSAWAGLAPVLVGRACDAEKIRPMLRGVAHGDLPLLLDIPMPGRIELLAILRRWLDWYTGTFGTDEHDPSWDGPRLEYRYSLGVSTPAGEMALRAAEANGGRTEWWALEAEAKTVGTQTGTATPIAHRAVATQLRYPGMPADRFWEFEDAKINLADLEVQPHDLGRLLVAECALVFGNDWLNIPVDVPPGSLLTIDRVSYTTTFGEVIQLDPVAPRGWRMFLISDAAGQPAGPNLGGLLVAPATGPRIEGPAVEEINLLRDEAANLVWAVERTVANELGDPTVRSGELLSRSASGHPAEPGTDLSYLLQTAVPQSWVPFLPQLSTDDDGSVTIHLVQSRLEWGGAPATEVKGTLLAEAGHQILFDAEVPRDGVRIRRVPVLARRADGTYDTWVARRVNVGRGEGSSGLAFDTTLPNE